jgi:hypothetical protein
MSLPDKIKRHFATLSTLGSQYKSVKDDWNSINWYKQHRQKGIPYERRSDKGYIDWFYNYRPALLKYKDIHKGEDCFIIGNGPSLNRTDLNLLKGYHVFGLNKIHMIFEKYPLLSLSYHVTVNSLVIEQMQKELNEDVMRCPSFLSYHAAEKHNFKRSNVHKILTNAQWSFYKSLKEPISEGYTVTYVAMQIAYFMGFKNVFLVGVDHNFTQTGKANEEQTLKVDDANHFHPDYFKGMQWHLADLEGNEASYALARHQYHADGREVMDATIDGRLNIFQKVRFEEALNLAKKIRVIS